MPGSPACEVMMNGYSVLCFLKGLNFVVEASKILRGHNLDTADPLLTIVPNQAIFIQQFSNNINYCLVSGVF